MKEIRALSLKQPWAWLVVNGYKQIENRPWRTERRGVILIHASQTFDTAGKEWLTNDIASRPIDKYQSADHHVRTFGEGDYTKGALVGEALLVDCVDSKMEITMRYGTQLYDADWFTGPHAMILDRITAYETPIPCRGMLGFFVPELDAAGLELLNSQRRL